MPRYIDADALNAYIESAECNSVGKALQAIDQMPTVSPDEVRGVVHCRECRYSEPRKVVGDKTELYCRLFIAGMRRNDFCSRGAKMEVSEDA